VQGGHRQRKDTTDVRADKGKKKSLPLHHTLATGVPGKGKKRSSENRGTGSMHEKSLPIISQAHGRKVQYEKSDRKTRFRRLSIIAVVKSRKRTRAGGPGKPHRSRKGDFHPSDMERRQAGSLRPRKRGISSTTQDKSDKSGQTSRPARIKKNISCPFKTPARSPTRSWREAIKDERGTAGRISISIQRERRQC